MGSERRRTNGVGATVSWGAALAGLVATLLVGAGLVILLSPGSDQRVSLVLATGPESGMYHTLGTAFARGLERRGVVDSLTVRATEGSVENMRLLETGAVDLAVVQSDTSPGDSARLIATLFEEELHVLVARRLADRVHNVVDLAGRRVSTGSPGSGTHQVAERVLHHLGVVVGERLALTPEEAARALDDDEVDAVFLLTAVPSTLVGELARRNAVDLVTLGDPQLEGNRADALALVYPRLHAAVIPRSTYGHLPATPILTVGVRAELVCTRDLDPQVVGRITRALFTSHADRAGLPEEAVAVAGRIRERYERGGGSVPYHPGAVHYYERFEPPFVVRYAESLSLAVTLLVGAWSGWIALRQWIQRRKKNRIDAYYLEVITDPPDLVRAGREELLERRARLMRVRERAFADLVAERLEADESFSIFQNQVAGELASIAVTLSQRGAAPGTAEA